MDTASPSLATAASSYPSFETIAALRPIAIEGRPVHDVIRELNVAITATGLEFGENEFSAFRYGPNPPETLPAFRWIDCSAVRGSNEGFYLHISVVPPDHDRSPTLLLATAKTWDWASALAISAAATRLLGD